MEVNYNEIRKNTQKREKLDRQMSIIWLLVYLLPLIVTVIFIGYSITSFSEVIFSIDFSNPQSYDFSYDWISQEVFLVFTLFAIFILINLVFSIVLNYLLIKRQRTHFIRQKAFFENLFSLIVSYEKANGVTKNYELLSFEEIIKDNKNEKEKKNPILWTVLSVFIPLIQFYVYYFLMADLYNHEKREDILWNNTADLLITLGFNFYVPPRNPAMPYRSFVLYLILTIVTGGFFLIYWIFVLLKDPNLHFNYHIQIEDKLLDVLKFS